jgi:hypothetical protein
MAMPLQNVTFQSPNNNKDIEGFDMKRFKKLPTKSIAKT